MNIDDWGLKMRFACQDGKTGTLSFQQSLNAGKPEGELSTGAMYVIEANDNGSWISYEDYIRKFYDIKTPRLIQFNYSSADFAA